MRTILDLLDSLDVCALPLLIVLLLTVGVAMVGSDLRIRLWGLRGASAAFIAYAVYAYVQFQPATALDFLGIVVRSLLAAGLMLGVSWISLAVTAHVWWIFIATSAHRFKAQPEAARAQLCSDQSYVARDQSGRFRQEEDQLRRTEELQKRQLDDERRSKAIRRREEARFSCLIVYDQHREKLLKRFPRRQLIDYFEKYMTEHHTVEQVEARAEQLKVLLRDMVSQSGDVNAIRFRSIAEINAYFDSQRESVANSNYDTDTKETLIADLNLEEDLEIAEFRKNDPNSSRQKL